MEADYKSPKNNEIKGNRFQGEYTKMAPRERETEMDRDKDRNKDRGRQRIQTTHFTWRAKKPHVLRYQRGT